VVSQHNARCEKEAKLVIHDQKLWTEFKEGGRLAFEARRARFGPETERATIEAVAGFDQRYGSTLAIDRDFGDEQILRNDIYILKGGTVVAQYIDFTASLKSLGGSTNLYCLGSHPELDVEASRNHL
jgi:hypothetical protein